MACLLSRRKYEMFAPDSVGVFYCNRVIEKMAITVLVGIQWGDEGKGKVIDVLTERSDYVVRYQGGNNAGHTVYVGEQKHVLHLVPSGILHKGKKCIIANGVVVDPIGLVKEIDGLEKLGFRLKDNFFIGETAHVVLPYHRELDAQRESANGKSKIGTTKRGIGPAYCDKYSRTGLRMLDLVNARSFPQKLLARINENNRVIRSMGGKAISYKAVLVEYQKAARRLRPFIANSSQMLHAAAASGASILFEGAQGTYLDIDHGTYPYVTSSNTTSGGACTGSGIPPNRIDRVVGVMKAYTTRVGEGPLPSENAEISDMLHGMGREFGATTGRARRCGWFDAVAARQAVMINGVDDLAVTNLDGLDTLSEIKVCVGYKVGKRLFDHVPNDIDVLASCKPVYRTFRGWNTPTTEARKWNDLPRNAKVYLKAVAELIGGKISLVSVGPARHQTIPI